MSRVSPTVFVRPGVAPGQIIARGGEQATASLAAGVLDLERRQDEMRRVSAAADQFNANMVELTQASIRANEGPIEGMPDEIESASASLRAQIDQQEDPILRAQMTRDLENQSARLMSRTLQVQNSRMVGKARATGEQTLQAGMDGIQAGTTTAGEVIKSISEYVSAQKENVYGDDADNVVESMAKQAIDEQFNVLLSSNPTEAAKYANGAAAKQWLTTKERARMEGTARGVNAATLRSIGGQAQDMFEAGDIEGLEAQRERIKRFPKSQVHEEIEVQIDSLISRFRNQVTSAERNALDNWNIIESGSDRALHTAPRTNNRTWEAAVNSQRELVYFDAFTRQGASYAPNAIKALDGMFSLENPQFDKGLSILRTIDRIDPDRVRLLLQSKAIENSQLVGTLFDVTTPGRAAVSQAKAIETMTRAGAPVALTKDTTKDGVRRSPATLNAIDVRRDNQSLIRQSFGLPPDSEIPDDAMDSFDSFYRFTYADLSTRPAAPVSDPQAIDEGALRMSMNNLSVDWAPIPRPGRGPIMVRADRWGVGSNAQPDAARSEKLSTFFTAIETDTGGFVAPGRAIRVGGETMAPVISRDIDAVTAQESVLGFAAVEPQTGTRRFVKKGDAGFDQALQVIETGRPLNPVGQIKRKSGEANSVAEADLATPLASGKLRGQIILNAVVDQWMRQMPRLPDPNSASEMEIFTDMMEQTARDIGFTGGIGLVEEEKLEPTVQVP